MSAETGIEVAGRSLDWASLMHEALTVPGGLGNTYCRFYDYSQLNQLLLYMQGAREPVATYDRWQTLGRQVMRGSKAYSILRPLMYKHVTDSGEEEQRVRGFKMVRCLFTVGQTEGDELPEVEPKQWNRAQALGRLAISEVPYEMVSGNTQGYSFERKIAINPVAKYPLKTTFHEVAHVVHGHTKADEIQEYRLHRGVREFQAESTAYICMNELQLADQMDPAESRAYIQNWLQGEQPPGEAIRRCFKVADDILKAGRAEQVAA